MAIDFSADQGVGFITFNRPPANAYDAQMLGELTQAVHRVAEDPAVRVAVRLKVSSISSSVSFVIGARTSTLVLPAAMVALLALTQLAPPSVETCSVVP